MARRWWLGWGLATIVTGAGCDEGGTVTAPALEVACEARPATGPVPLAVSFLVSVSGAQGPFSVSISYGDGSSGTSPDAPHVYTTAGSFTASFTVTTATQSARCATAVTPVGAAPAPGGNQPPLAVFKTTPDAAGSRITGPAPLAVRFNLCASMDPERDVLFFEMDFDGDGRFDKGGTTGAQCRSDHVYPAGTWRPLVCVRDVDANGGPLHERQCARYTVTATP